MTRANLRVRACCPGGVTQHVTLPAREAHQLFVDLALAVDLDLLAWVDLEARQVDLFGDAEWSTIRARPEMIF